MNNIFLLRVESASIHSFLVDFNIPLRTVSFRAINTIFVLKIKPLTDARLYGHKDICRILEVNRGKDFINDHPMVIKTINHSYGTN